MLSASHATYRSWRCLALVSGVLGACTHARHDDPGDSDVDASRRDASAGENDAQTTRAARPSAACGPDASAYKRGTTAGDLVHMGAPRTFRVHLPARYDGLEPVPLLLMFHGGGGSSRQFELASSRMDAVAERENFAVVYPDGSGLLKTWNGAGCCGYAVTNDIDDVGFVAALLNHLESVLCLDTRRVYAAGMSNGAIFTHRLACELATRIAAIAPVAGTDMTTRCAPARPVPIMQIHGSSDGHVPWSGGEGCGPAGVSFTSVPTTLAQWRSRNGCGDGTQPYFEQGDGQCVRSEGCSHGADVVLCTVQGGGHNWPGGDPPADLVMCPADGFQSSTFSASEMIWRFVSGHALP